MDLLRLACTRFADEENLARFVAASVTDTCLYSRTAPQTVLTHMMQPQRDIPFDALWMIAADLNAAMWRSGLDTSDRMLEAKLAAALAGVTAAVKIVALRDPQILRTEAFEASIAAMFLGMLRADPLDVPCRAGWALEAANQP